MQEPLGGGRRYEVFLVWDEGLGEQAVAKVLRPDRAEDKSSLRMLRREAILLERLAHPALVRRLDAVFEGPYPHVLLEYVDGANLKDLLAGHVTLEAEVAIELAVDVLEVLEHFAANDVVHLDVKPSNIVMTDPTKLIDLGAARMLDELAERTEPIGTAAYMAPEQCEPAANGPIGPPADVWGLGATLYHALTGNQPFSKPAERGSAASERYPQLVESPLAIPDYVPDDLAEIVMWMLTRDPRERPTAGAAADALDALLD